MWIGVTRIREETALTDQTAPLFLPGDSTMQRALSPPASPTFTDGFTIAENEAGALLRGILRTRREANGARHLLEEQRYATCRLSMRHFVLVCIVLNVSRCST
jgi:hypothetical protein